MTRSTTVRLTWSGPWTFRQLLLDAVDAPGVDGSGVYVWTETIDGEENVIYVGKSKRPIRKRQLEHYRCMIGGMYWLPSRTRENQKEWVPTLQVGKSQEGIFDRSNFLSIVTDGFKYSELIRIYFASAINVSLLQLERNLIAQWRPEQNGKVNLRNEERLTICHMGTRLPSGKRGRSP